VFVLGGDVADPGVQAQGVVAVLDEGELGLEYAGVGDLLQVRVLGLGVAEEGLDPGLVGRGDLGRLTRLSQRESHRICLPSGVRE